jgi:hypothetical protein
MQAAIFNTVTIPSVGTVNPATLANASTQPLRIVVRNIGPVLMFIGGDTESLASPGGPSTGVFRLPAAASEVFVIAPKQGLYAVSAGAGGLASLAISEALPVQDPTTYLL